LIECIEKRSMRYVVDEFRNSAREKKGIVRETSPPLGEFKQIVVFPAHAKSNTGPAKFF